MKCPNVKRVHIIKQFVAVKYGLLSKCISLKHELKSTWETLFSH